MERTVGKRGRNAAGRPVMDNALLLGLNGQIVMMAAHRYALGRMTYVPAAVIQFLDDARYAGVAELNTRRVCVRDTVEALQDNACGSEYDRALWLAYAQREYAALPEYDRQWVRDAVAHRQRPWPLHEGDFAPVV